MFCVRFLLFKLLLNNYNLIKLIIFFLYRCAQCFRPFPEGIFYEFEGRKYCEHDFHVLFAPCCGKCGKILNIVEYNVELQ